MSSTGTVNNDFLVGSGEMVERIRNFDWATTPLGPVDSWSPGLLTTVNIVLANRFPMLLWWGEEYTCIYNDAYIPILGTKHPWALGQPVSICWSEIWHVLQPLIDTPFKGGASTWMEDILLELNRHGYMEETHFTIAYSPVPDERAATRIGGVLATVVEISEKVVAERRVNCLRDLGVVATKTQNAKEACKLSAEIISHYSKDIPYALLYLFDEEQKQLQLIHCAGWDTAGEVDPFLFLPGSRQENAKTLEEILQSGKIQIVKNFASRFSAIPQGPWNDKPKMAAIIPLHYSQLSGKNGLLICGISSRLAYDQQYQFFFELLGSQISSAISSAIAFEEERKRSNALLEIDKAKTLFISNISHEFRTPLTLMLGPIEDALNDPGTIPQNRERLRIVQRNALRMQKLVNNLLDFSRIEAGRITATYEPVDLAEFTMDLASSFRSVMEKAGIDFVVNCPALSQPVWIDKDMWEKIVLNLLSNAFKFTWEGQVTVEMNESNGMVNLVVKDSGVGIPTSEQDKIFDRFHRVEKANGRSIEGTGIGLALVNELVKLHDGVITVSSEENLGSTFIVTIPHKNSKVIDEKTHHAPATISGLAGSYIAETDHWSANDSESIATHDEITDTKYVLVVDDNADMRSYLTRMLSTEYEVKTVANGLAALAAIKERKPHLVISDIMMPGIDGFELLKNIKSDKFTQSIQVILLSARAGEESVNEGLHKGADAYLVKPFTGQQLKAIVRNRLQIQESREQIEESERQLQRVFRQAPFSLAVLEGEDLVFKLVNEKTAELLTLPENEILGKTLFEVIPEFEDVEFGTIIKEVFRTGKPYIAREAPATFKRHGEMVTGYFDFVYEPLYDEAGIVKGVISLAIEVTDKVNARRKIEESEERFRNMANETPLFMWVTDEKLKTTFLNKTGLDYFNVNHDSHISSLSWKLFIHPDDIDRVLSTMKNAAQAQTAYSLEMRLKNGTSGEYRWFLDKGIPRYTNGNFCGFIGTSLDIHDLKQGEELLERRVKQRTKQIEEKNLQLQQQKDFVQTILDSSKDLVVVLDTDLRYISVNKSVEKLYNITTAGIAGKHLLDVFPKLADQHDVLRNLEQCLRGETGHIPIIKSTVMNRWFQNYCVPLKDVNGGVYGVVIIGHDITEIIDAAEKVNAKNAELESTIALLRSQQLKDQQKDSFIQMASHELKTPLTSIKAYSQLLARTYGDTSDIFLKNGLMKVENQVNKMTKLVGDFLNVTKMESGKFSIEMEKVDITGLAREVLTDMQMITGYNRISMEHAEPLYVLADKEKIAQVLINFLNNAVKYSPDGESVIIKVRPTGTGWVTVSVEDKGRGIPVDEQEKIFERFYRSKQNNDNFSGFGIGLFISAEIISRHSGRIGVNSIPGQGATFYFQLPIVD